MKSGAKSKSSCVQRMGTVQDIEQATVFLFSEGANWITGVTLVVDGMSS